jgi:glutamate N-acetyltransferase / amino-acid N-acetyltransferase
MDAMSVVSAAGFLAVGVEAGIKHSGLDLAIVMSERPAIAAGVFTTNQAAAAPVRWCRSVLAGGAPVRAVVLNSGCANAATGAEGEHNTMRMAGMVGSALAVAEDEVLVCSTGTIGPQLPMDSITKGITAAIGEVAATPDAGTLAARAIMTTDSVPKESTVTGDGWSVGGMAKGAGMLRPDMATMLAVVTTDAVIDHATLDASLRRAVDGSFNSLNVDGCESTNDTVLVIANGASGRSPDPDRFDAALRDVCRDLAIRMARDAEGASRLVTIEVTGAADDTEARHLGRLIADSALVRASFYGGDVNWGRIVGQLGTTDIEIDFEQVDVVYEGVTVFSGGIGVPFDEPNLLEVCAAGDLTIGVRVGKGAGEADIVTTDLTPEYVIFNGERS